MAKYTHEEFLEEVHKNRPDVEILEGKYTNIKSRFVVRHNVCGYEWETDAEHLVQPKGCPKCSGAVKLTTQDIISKMETLHPNIEVVGEYVNNHTGILCKCRIDDYEWSPIWINLQKAGCPVCSNRVIIPGYNDFNTAHPELVKYLANPEDGRHKAPNSNKKVLCKCPDCGFSTTVYMNNLAKVGFSCKRCGDGISYPNKFIRELLRQLIGNDYICEYTTDWCKDYYYDCYFKIDNNSYIIEMDGGFHFIDNKWNNKTVDDIAKIDRIKDQLAKNHNIIMIRIDSQKSDVNYLRTQIESSLLNEIFDLSVIDWKKCDEMATSNYAKYVCEYYQKHKFEKMFEYIAKDLHISVVTLRQYLKQGVKFGWCETSHKERLDISNKLKTVPNARPIRISFASGEIVDVNSIATCVRFLRDKGIVISDYIISRRLKNNNGKYQFDNFHLEFI